MLSRRKFAALAGASAAATAAGALPARAQQTAKYKMQSMWQAGTINQKVFEDYCTRVKAMTNGRLDIEPLAVGTIVAYTETLDAMQSGILDAHQSGGPYFSGKEPALALIGDLNGGYDNPYQMQMWFEYGGASNWRARSTSASTSTMSVRCGGAWNRCRPRSRCARWPTSRASRCGYPRASAPRSGAAPVPAS